VWITPTELSAVGLSAQNFASFDTLCRQFQFFFFNSTKGSAAFLEEEWSNTIESVQLKKTLFIN
jgi:hypothetical protein